MPNLITQLTQNYNMPFTSASQPSGFTSASDVIIDKSQQDEAKGLEGFVVGLAQKLKDARQNTNIGIGKSALGLAKGFAKVGDYAINKVTGIPKVTDEATLTENASKGDKVSQILLDKNLEAQGTFQKIGKTIGDVAQYAIPSASGEKVASKVVPKVLNRAVNSATVASLQANEIGSDTAIAGATELAVPVVGKYVATPAKNIIGRIIKGLGSAVSGKSTDVLNQIIDNPKIAKSAVQELKGTLKPNDVIKNLNSSGNIPKLISDVKTGGGGTLNLDGSPKELANDFLVSIRNKNVPTESISEKDIQNFIKENKDIISKYGDRVKIGTFDLGNGKSSIDLNLALQDEKTALELAKKGGQQSVFDEAMAKATNFGDGTFIQTGFDGLPTNIPTNEIDSLIGNFVGNDSLLTKNTDIINTGIQKIRQEARKTYGETLDSVNSADISPKAYRNAIQPLFEKYGINFSKKEMTTLGGKVVDKSTRNLDNIEFTEPANIAKAKKLISSISSAELNGKSLKQILKDIEKSRFVTATSDERLSFNAFVNDLEKGVIKAINESTPKFMKMNRNYSKDLQLTDTMESIFTKVDFNNQEELNKASQKLETLFSKKGLSPKDFNQFLDRIGVPKDEFKTSEAVRQITNVKAGDNKLGFNISEILQSITQGVISPKLVRDIAIATGEAEPVIQKIISSTNPYVRATFIDALTKLNSE